MSSRPRGWWSHHPAPPEPRSVVELIRSGTLDAELAALLWLLLEARLPVLVAASRSGAGKSTVLGALLDFLPPGTRRHELRGAYETFEWLPHARELGWSEPAAADGAAVVAGDPAPPEARADGPEHATPATAYLLAAELSDHRPEYTWGDAARVAVRAVSVGYGLGATIHADSLEEVFDALHRPPVALTDDELSRIGVVLVVRAVTPAPGDVSTGPVRRIVAAHYVRPVARDVHGHVQRLNPAVLATWDAAEDRFEHFAWGVAAELGERIGRRTGDLLGEQERRRGYLAGLAEAGVTQVEAVRAAIDGYRATPDGLH